MKKRSLIASLLTLCSLLTLTSCLSFGFRPSGSTGTDADDGVTTEDADPELLPLLSPDKMEVGFEKEGVYTMKIPKNWSTESFDPMVAAGPNREAHVTLSIEDDFDKVKCKDFTNPADIAKQARSLYTESFKSAVVGSINTGSAEIGGVDAATVKFCVETPFGNIRYLQAFCIKDGSVYTLTFSCMKSIYSERLTDFRSMLNYFEFGENPPAPETKPAPEGMTLFNPTSDSYRAWLPKDWVGSNNSEDSGQLFYTVNIETSAEEYHWMASIDVSVTPNYGLLLYSSEDVFAQDALVALIASQGKRNCGPIELTSVKLAGKSRPTIRMEVGGEQICQTYVIESGCIYVFTFKMSKDAEDFNTRWNEALKIYDLLEFVH